MRVLAALVSLMLAGSAAAEPFWVEYNASSGLFPEEVGWERVTYGGGAERWFEEGALVLDGSGSTGIVDAYGIAHPLYPAPNEVFVMEWRMRVDAVEGFTDPLVNVSSGNAVVYLTYTTDAIYSLLEGMWIEFIPGIFHEYAFTSSDMQTYHLHIDGELAHTGVFVGPDYGAGVGWGDAGLGSSMSTWTFVRFGVVPEPSTAVLLAIACLPGVRRAANSPPQKSP